MEEPNEYTRLNKFEKRRKNTRRIMYLSILAGLIFLFLIGSFVFGSKDTEKEVQTPEESTPEVKDDKDTDEESKDTDEEEEEAKDTEDEEKDNEEEDEEKDKSKETEDDIVTENVDPSDDNVANAFKGNWEPIQTEQSGQHTTDLSSGGQDRKEIEEAIQMATGLGEMTVWWLDRSGEPDVLATASSKVDESEVYRVYLNWVDGKGWQPDKVELLKENDEKWRFN